MKLTDMAMVFEVFVICLIVVVHMKSGVKQAELMNQVMYNNVMDVMVEDALRAGFYSVDRRGEPQVNLTELSSCFVAEAALCENISRHILIYVEKDGFYSSDTYSGFVWGDKHLFDNGELSKHEEKVRSIADYLKEQYGVSVAIPTNEGETWQNTVKEYSLLCVSYDMNTDICCFSGAIIENRK